MDITKATPPFELLQLDTCLIDVLKKIEKDTGLDLMITSGFRSVKYEIRMGRDGSSSHTLGKAVDLYCYSSRDKYLLVKSALQNGVNRIGIYKTFVHLDVATAKDGKTTNVIWYG